MDETRFGFDAYHILLVALGASLLLCYRLPHLFIRRPPAATALLMACGMAGSLLFPSIVAGIDPTVNPLIWKLAAEFVVIVVLFATGCGLTSSAGFGSGRRRPGFSPSPCCSPSWPSPFSAGVSRG